MFAVAETDHGTLLLVDLDDATRIVRAAVRQVSDHAPRRPALPPSTITRSVAASTPRCGRWSSNPASPVDSATSVAEAASALHMSMTTNSAGFIGAKPITTRTTPSSRSPCVIVVRSQRTKNASRGFRPWNAPCRHRSARNTPTATRTLAHKGSSFGSNTAHCNPRSMLRWRDTNNRRTLTYFHSASLESVRPPQTRMPAPRTARIALTPASASQRPEPCRPRRRVHADRLFPVGDINTYLRTEGPPEDCCLAHSPSPTESLSRGEPCPSLI